MAFESEKSGEELTGLGNVPAGEEDEMSKSEPWISGDHKAQLISDGIHGFVVVFVVLATSVLAALRSAIPIDVVGTVFGGAIGYAAGRAGNIARSRGGG